MLAYALSLSHTYKHIPTHPSTHTHTYQHLDELRVAGVALVVGAERKGGELLEGLVAIGLQLGIVCVFEAIEDLDRLCVRVCDCGCVGVGVSVRARAGVCIYAHARTHTYIHTCVCVCT